MLCMGWVKAKGCESGTCVEVSAEYGSIGVRNSTVPGETVWFDEEEWRAFTNGVKAGEFDLDRIDPGRLL